MKKWIIDLQFNYYKTYNYTVKKDINISLKNYWLNIKPISSWYYINEKGYCNEYEKKVIIQNVI